MVAWKDTPRRGLGWVRSGSVTGLVGSGSVAGPQRVRGGSGSGPGRVQGGSRAGSWWIHDRHFFGLGLSEVVLCTACALRA